MWRARSIQPEASAHQLLSLLRTSLAASSITAVRSFSAVGPAEDISIAYSKERKSHEVSLSQLRKQWAREHKESSSKAAAFAEAARDRRAAAKVQRAQQDKASAEAKRKELLDQQAAERAVRAQAQKERLARAQLREDVLEYARQERRGWLLQQSRQWVGPEALEQRVADAIDHPLPLYPAASGHRQQ